ncbi:MAG: TetR/AcrR family transcriptional regulator [Eubacterium sp.]
MAKKDGTLDLRIKRTQRAIKEAFFALVEEKGFEHISVKDITDKAMISRNTFYLHYSDKYDLLNKICDELTRKLFFGVGKQIRKTQRLDISIESAAKIIQMGAVTISEDRDAYRILLASSCGDILMKKTADIIRRALDLIKNDIEGISEYSIEYIVSGMSGMMKYYAANNLDIRIVENGAMNFAKLHLGAIIDNINAKKGR